MFKDNTVGIVSKYEDRLKLFQKMLWSVGVLSKVTYDPLIDRKYNNNFKLEIIGEYQGYPGFTYLVDSIEHLLLKDNEIISYEPMHVLEISNISLCDQSGHNHAKGYMKNLILEKPKAYG